MSVTAKTWTLTFILLAIFLNVLPPPFIMFVPIVFGWLAFCFVISLVAVWLLEERDE